MLLIISCRIIAELCFLLPAISKILAFKKFVSAVADFGFFKNIRWAIASSVLVVFMELVVGAAMIGGWLLTWATAASILLLTIFSAAILLAILRGRSDISCGCLGAIGRKRPIGQSIVLRNLALACLVLMSVFHEAASVLVSLAIFLAVWSLASIDVARTKAWVAQQQ